ncbi:CLUMA_CG020162, isoform A [Clunio marinus]|uniref:CLUMA_CG020162, isoform A n=1 Tax=Clunio marinus TaxID=568069 RepID=A0A1J1J6R7_9DIPT|nr:CLUMA_CG020162, isoform A [Clunio marinus]
MSRRSFTTKLTSFTAAEVRKAVQTDQIIATNNSFYSSSISLNDLVDSLDFEDFLQQKSQTLIVKDPLRNILEFPTNDVIIVSTPRKIRTENYVLPEEYENKSDDIPVQIYNCIRAFTKPWKYVKFACRDDVLHDKYGKKIDPLSYHHQEYEIDSCISFISSLEDSTLMNGSCSSLISSTATDKTLSCRDSWVSGFEIEEINLRSVASDPLLPILERVTVEKTEIENEDIRNKNRLQDIFSLQLHEENDKIERRLPAEVPMEHIGSRILIKFLELKFDIEIEPIFCSAAVYDCKAKKKISENFYFDMNSESIKHMLNSHVAYTDISTTSRSAAFEITHPSNDLFLVIRLEKVLQGSSQDSVEPYLKEYSNIEKSKANALYYTERLGKYRAPFGFTALYLNKIFKGDNGDVESFHSTSISSNSLDRKSSSNFDQFKKKASETVTSISRRGSLERRENQTSRQSFSPYEDFSNQIESFKPISITISSFFKQESEKMKDEDLFKFLPELKRPNGIMKKYKCIPGSIKVEVGPYNDGDVINALTPELAKVKPYCTEERNLRPMKEVLEFPLLPIFNPHYSYRNLLYISPKELNFSTRAGSARNIAVKIQIMSGEQSSDALNIIYGKSSCPQFQSEMYTIVNYHNRNPTFYDEVKVQLPPNLNQNHHILFTVFHVSCRADKAVQHATETPIGWSWIPLLIDGRLNIGEFNLPILLHEPPKSYSFITPDVNLPGTKWLDNHKPLFNVTLDSYSTVYTEDSYICKFFYVVQCLESKKIPPHIGSEMNMEKELKKSIHDLQCSDLYALVKNLQLVMDKLLEMLIHTYTIGNHVMSIHSNVFEAICLIADKLFILQQDTQASSYGRQAILSTYVQYQATILHPTAKSSSLETSVGDDEDLSADKVESSNNEVCRLLHEEIALHWVVANNTAAELSLTNSWMLFELIIKSMIEHLDFNNTLNAPRKNRFSRQFTDDVQTLVHMIATKIIGYHNSDKNLAMSLNNSLAFFIFDLFNILDRGFVFMLIKNFLKVMTTKSSAIAEVNHYKLDFLRIVCSHEHFIAMNLPFGTPFTYNNSAPCSPTLSIKSSNSQQSAISSSGPTNQEKSAFADLSVDFRQQHFLIGLMLTEIAHAFEMQNQSLHGRAIRCIKSLMTSHEVDFRYRSKEARSRISALYLPLLNIVMNAPLHNFKQEHYLLDDYQGSTNVGAINPEIFQAISGSHLYTINSDNMKQAKAQLNESHTKDLLLCFLWVIKNLENSVLLKFITCLPLQKVHRFLQILNNCIPCFEYQGRVSNNNEPTSVGQKKSQSFRKTSDLKEKLEDIIRGTGSARNELINRRKEGGNTNEKYRWRKDQFFNRPSREGSEAFGRDSFAKYEEPDAIYIAGSLATEISLIILDTLEIIIQVASTCEVHNNLLGSVLKILLHALSRNQSVHALMNLFASQRSFVNKFHNLLFDEESDNCADLCLLLLKHCGSSLSTVRSQAAGSLYCLMRQNFEFYGNNFSRVKMLITISLSSLVGGTNFDATFSEASLRRSLKTVLVYAEEENQELQETTFPEQVKDLLFNLHMILSDTVKMKEYQEDHEMLLDLMNRIAKGYQNSPDLRLTWLENMSKKHIERSNYTESAMCHIHMCALVAEYLYMLESQTYLPIGAVSFRHITPNVLSESAVSDDVLSPGDDGICMGNRFTEAGLKNLLEVAAEKFQIAGMYEAMNNVYKILIPVLEHSREFQKLAKVHGKLQEAFNRIHQLSGKRVFATYFRVGFYGPKLGDLDQNEYIYKEPPFTKLPEIFNRLQMFYEERFGSETVVIIKDSNLVDVSSLDPEKIYIQITFVEPYFEAFELRQRETHFERNFNINRFIFSTPFTKAGKAHGELHEQYKRKTILTTNSHFPSVKTRIQVIHRQQLILEPIEVAIEDIQKKTVELAAATNQEPADPKILQMVLQGCIGTTVNQGPMEMALVFLSGIADGQVEITKEQNKLRLCFKDFTKKCNDALKKNKNLISNDQRDYQKELERNYLKFTERLNPLINITRTYPLRISSNRNNNKSYLRW